MPKKAAKPVGASAPATDHDPNDVFTDHEPDDAFADGDDQISYDRVDEVALAFDAIEQIEDPDERRKAAADYFAVMAAEATTGGDV